MRVSSHFILFVCTTFAWFTSKDEVTNRLSANADYDVSIVESFAPPKNWLPGQEVNKDVYATNTGNIAAFVKESISGRLTVTKEQATKEKTANSITITGDERYAVEAGAYLAYAPDGSTKKLGSLVVVRPDDQGVPKVTDFVPDVEGLYVFRRSITVDGASNPVGKETFIYDGYYFVPGEGTNPAKYYKISNLQTLQANATNVADDGIFTDGNLASANAGFVEEVKEVVNPTAMTYDSSGHRLVIEYDTGNNAAVSALEQAAAARDAALHNVQYAAELVAAAQRESTAADTGTGGLSDADTALSDAYNEYVQALSDLDAANRALTEATLNDTNAKTALTAAENAVKASKMKLYGAENGTESTATADSLKGKLNAATTAKGSVTETNPTAEAEFTTELANWLNDNTVVGRVGTTRTTLTVADLELFKTWILSKADTDEKHNNFELLADYEIAKKNYDIEYSKLYGGTIDDGKNESDGNYTTDSIYGKYKAADDAVNSDTNGTAKKKSEAETAKNLADDAVNNDTNGKKKLYENALATYKAALSTSNAKKAALEDAQAQQNAANAALTAAEANYNTAAAALNNATDKLKIYVNLANDVTGTVTEKDKWELLPTDLVNNTADFYYTGILEGGETSSKLIDSLELDSSVTQDMYKSFDFDLDVKLDSAQIAYASDDTTIIDDAARAEFGRYATITNPTSVENAVLDWN